MPGDDCATEIKAAVERGLLSIEKIDEIVARVLTEKFRVGLFEKPYTDEDAVSLRTPEAVETAREVARESIVVLENKGILPLAAAGNQRIAVIGPTADDPLAQLSGYSFPAHLILSEIEASTSDIVTPLAGLRQAFGGDKVRYAKGVEILERREYGAPTFPGDVQETANVERVSPVSMDVSRIPEAVALANESDVTIVCVGDLAGLFQTGTVGEGSDADSLDLPGVQQELLAAVVATGKPVVVVLTGGRPYNLQGLEAKVAAFVWAFSGGEQIGHALADILSGASEPTGRLPLSVPKNVGAVPYYYNHKLKSAGTPIAFHFGSRYPFGYGLAYTQFEYSDLRVESESVDIERGEIKVCCRVRNSGTRQGVAVPQLYLRDVLASVVRPVKELKAFGRVELQPGEAADVTFSVPVDMLCFTGYDGNRVVEAGQFELQVGASSADIRLRKTVEVKGNTRRLGRDWRMFSQCNRKVAG